ncbi:MAG TPA: BlaI/MecI/CopY family transcriptional regulator, partial [Thermoanaerobaculia bacterium]|nr:BlaI/MecI/CopY family transcriptional regulator [Thermoanaerobaculia bacterium]
RLVKKGALKYKEEGNRYLYRPAFPREKYIAEESRTFLDRVFGGDAAPMLVHFVEHGELSDDDIAELRALLDRRKKEEGR